MSERSGSGEQRAPGRMYVRMSVCPPPDSCPWDIWVTMAETHTAQGPSPSRAHPPTPVLMRPKVGARGVRTPHSFGASCALTLL